MKTLAKIAAALMLASFIATTATVAQAAPKMMTTKTVKIVKKKGYVHAHTYVKKNGSVVHVKGHYRHHPKMAGKKMVVIKKTVTKNKMAPMKGM